MKTASVAKKSPRPSRAKNIWYRCQKCMKKTSSHSRLCQSDTCTGLLELITPANKNLGVFQITKHWFSVRRNVAGQPIRCFVNTLTKECTYCLSLLNCIHVKAVEAEDIKQTKKLVPNTDKMSEEDKDWINNEAREIYVLGEEKIYVLLDNSQSNPNLVHCSLSKCYLCNLSNSLNSGPRKEGPNCVHKLSLSSVLYRSSLEEHADESEAQQDNNVRGNNPSSDSYQLSSSELDPRSFPKAETDKSSTGVNHALSSSLCLKQILTSFPTHLDQDLIVKSLQQDLPENLAEYLDIQFNNIQCCPNCSSTAVTPYKYNKNNPSCIFISLSEIKKVFFKVKYCSRCEVIIYPNLTKYNMINAHIKVIMSFSFYRSVLSLIKNSSSVIKVMNDNLTDLSHKSGINLDSIQNISQDVYRSCLTIAAAVITEQDMNNVSCPTCGILPEITYSDGNVKNASRVPDNLTYTDVAGEVRDLFEFKSTLVEEVFSKNPNKNFKMSKKNAFSIPSIMPPIVKKENINTEHLKFKNSSYQKDLNLDIHKVADCFITGSLSIQALRDGTTKEEEIRQIYSHCSSASSKKMGMAAMRQALISTFGCILAGESECHNYVIRKSFTGGWTDLYCEHNFKFGSKMMIFKVKIFTY